MSRWAAAFHAFKTADTVDSVDTVAPPTGLPPHSVNRVNIVMGGVGSEGAATRPADLPAASQEQAADEVADRAAIEAEPLLPAACRAAEPPPDMVAALAEAMTTLMLASRVYAGTTPTAALDYCRGQARRRLALLPDPLARGLLLAAERQRATACSNPEKKTP